MKKENNELQSRREFFKKAAKGALPILGFALLGGSLLSSCTPDDDNNDTQISCSDCSGTCYGSCSGECHQSCSGDKW